MEEFFEWVNRVYAKQKHKRINKMTLFEKFQQDITTARKAGDKQLVTILSVVIGEAQSLKFTKGRTTDVQDEEVIKIIRKLVEDNELLIQNGKTDLIKENEILSTMLPKMASIDEIRTALQNVVGEILGARNEGQARGIAIKYLKTQDIKADNVDVIAVLAELFGTK